MKSAQDKKLKSVFSLLIEKSKASTIGELACFLHQVSQEEMSVKGVTPKDAEAVLLRLGISSVLVKDKTPLEKHPATADIFRNIISNTPPHQKTFKIMSLGDKSASVFDVNRKLLDLCVLEGALNDTFDINTEKAVKHFQRSKMSSKNSKKLYTKYGSVCEETMKALNKAYAVYKAREVYGLPGLGQSTINNLKKAEIHHLLDAKKVDLKNLPEEVKIPKRIAGQLKILAEISSATGLTPENAYAVNKFGGVKSAADYNSLSEKEIKEITKKAKSNNLLSSLSIRQLDFHLKRMEQAQWAELNDIRRVFHSVKGTEAQNLADIGITKGSDLRVMNIKKTAKLTGLNESRLKQLKHAAELLPVRGISPKVAMALVEHANVKGIKSLAKLSPSSLKRKAGDLIRVGIVTPEDIKPIESNSETIILACTSVTDNPVSRRKYLDYLIDLWEDDSTPPATALSAKIAALNKIFKQDFGRRQEDDDFVLVTDIVISVLEQAVLNVLKILRNEAGLPILLMSGEPRQLIINSIKTLPDVHSFWNNLENNTLWAKHRLPLPDSFGGAFYVMALVELYLAAKKSLRMVPVNLPKSVVGMAQELSQKYKINLFCSGTKETTWLRQACLTLQEELYDLDISYEMYQEWTNHIFVKIFPENYYKYKIPWMGIIVRGEVAKDLSGISENVNLLMGYLEEWEKANPCIVLEEPLSVAFRRLRTIQNLVLADNEMRKAFNDVQNPEYFSSLRSYNNAERRLYHAKNQLPYPTYYSIEDVPDEPLFVYDVSPARLLPPEIDEEYMVRYDERINFNPSSGIIEDDSSEKELDALIILEHFLAYHIDRYTTVYDVLLETAVNFYEAGASLYSIEEINPSYINGTTTFISLCLTQMLQSIWHYLFFTLPMCKGEVLCELGYYEKAMFYYNFIYNLSEKQAAYPYLNIFTDIPLIHIKHGSNQLNWANFLYQENDLEGIIKAKCLYKNVLELYDDYIIIEPFPHPLFNPKIQQQIQNAQIELKKIESGLNFLGFSEDMIPILRYPHLLNQAKVFLQIAISNEKDFIQFLTSAESEGLSELQAQQAVVSAAANLKVEQAREKAAAERVKLADKQKEQLLQEIGNLEEEIKEAKDDIFEDAEKANASDQYASTFSAFGIPVGNIANQFSYGTLGNFMSKFPKMTGYGYGMGDEIIGTFGGRKAQEKIGGWLHGDRSPIETQQQAAQKARENQIAKMERQLALMKEYGLPIAQKQIDIANAELEVTRRQVEVAKLQVQHTQQIVTYLQNKFFNKELWYELAREVKVIYKKILHYANVAAYLTERALEYEMNLQLNVIRFDYYRPEKHGLLGAEQLQSDIATLEFQRAALKEKKKIPVKSVISIREEFPQKLASFMETGKLKFGTDFTQFDSLFPGSYQSRINRVELIVEGLIPVEGIRGTLSTSGVSYIRTKDRRINPLIGNPEAMILSSYTIRGDQMIFYKSGEELELFEGLGVVTDWEIDIPKDANHMNYQTITDIKLIIYYDTFFDNDLRQYDIKRKPKGSDAYLAYSARYQFPDAFYHFYNEMEKEKPNDNMDKKYKVEIEIPTSAIYFPANQANRRVENISVILAAAEEGLPDPMPYLLEAKNNENALIIIESCFKRQQQGLKSISDSSNVGALDNNGVPKPLSPLNGFWGIEVDQIWRLEIRFNGDDTVQSYNGLSDPDKKYLYPKMHPKLFKKNDNNEWIPDVSKITDVLFFIHYEYDRMDLVVSEHFKDEQKWPTGTIWRRGNWEVKKGIFVGKETNANSEIWVKREETDASIKNKIKDMCVTETKVMVSDNGANCNNTIRLYFANGNYLFEMKRQGSTLLQKLVNPYNTVNAEILAESQNPENLIVQNRWYSIQVGRFGNCIDVEIDGRSVFQIIDENPKTGAEIALGSQGKGEVKFDYLLI